MGPSFVICQPLMAVFAARPSRHKDLAQQHMEAEPKGGRTAGSVDSNSTLMTKLFKREFI
jgi:hypothetical protein